jgi:hypothetical protein
VRFQRTLVLVARLRRATGINRKLAASTFGEFFAAQKIKDSLVDTLGRFASLLFFRPSPYASLSYTWSGRRKSKLRSNLKTGVTMLVCLFGASLALRPNFGI